MFICYIHLFRRFWYFFSNIKTFYIVITIDSIFEVIYININIKNDICYEIRQKNIVENCPKGDFSRKDERKVHIYLLLENIYGNQRY